MTQTTVIENAVYLTTRVALKMYDADFKIWFIFTHDHTNMNRRKYILTMLAMIVLS